MARSTRNTRPEPFEVGAHVRLSCGGPTMVVARITATRENACTWFAGSTMHRETFQVATLVRVVPVGTGSLIGPKSP